MSKIIKLTKDLKKFKWTNYDNVGENNSAIQRDRPIEEPLPITEAGKLRNTEVDFFGNEKAEGFTKNLIFGGQTKFTTDALENFNVSTPQTFTDGRSNIITGQQTFERPQGKSLEDMKSKFGIHDTEPHQRGPYRTVDFMDGTKQGSGFIIPGQSPSGFTQDMEYSEIVVNNDISLTPLAYDVAATTTTGPFLQEMSSQLDITDYFFDTNFNTLNPVLSTSPNFGSNPYNFNNDIPYVISEAYPNNAYQYNFETQLGSGTAFVNNTGWFPNADTYSNTVQIPPIIGTNKSQITQIWSNSAISWDANSSINTNTPESDTFGQPYSIGAPDGNVSYYTSLSAMVGRISMFQGEDGNYRTPSGLDFTEPGSGELSGTFPNFLGTRPYQLTFYIPADYPNDDLSFGIDTQFGSSFENPHLPFHGYGTFPIPIPTDHTPLAIRFLNDYVDSGAVWPYKILSPGDEGDQPYIRREIGDRYILGQHRNFNFKNIDEFIHTWGEATSYMSIADPVAQEDKSRIERFLKSPTGTQFMENQHMLQNLNPRSETRLWSKSNLLKSISGGPFIHPSRHFGGDTYMEEGDFGTLFDEDYKDNWMSKMGDWIGNALSSVNAFAGGINFGDGGGRLNVLRKQYISEGHTFISGGGFSSFLRTMRSKYSPFGRPPTLPTQVVFSQAGPFGSGRASTSKGTDGVEDENTLKRYQTLSYGALGTMDYESTIWTHTKGTTPTDKAVDATTTSKDAWDKAQKTYNDDFDARQKEVGIGPPAFNKELYDSIDDAHKAWVSAEAKVGTLKAENEAIKLKNSISLSTIFHGDIKGGGTGNQGKPGMPAVGDAALGVIKKGSLNKYQNELTDKVNMIPYGDDYKKADTGKLTDRPGKDFIKFRFKDLYNNKFIIFRALLNGISDTISPEWGDIRYIGRPDKVYVYQGSERKISFNFDIYPKTKQEFPILLEKLNYLVGLCYPSFTTDQRMVAPFIELTLGDMFKDTPGFLAGLTVTVDDNSTWETEEGFQFPKYIKCSCEFTYVGKYLPSTLGKHYELGWLKDEGWSTDKNGAFSTKGTFKAGGTRPDRQSFKGIGGKDSSLDALFTEIQPETQEGK